MTSRWLPAGLCVVLIAGSPSAGGAGLREGGAAAVPQCGGVHLTAAYLAQVEAGQGPGFLLTVRNDTDKPIKLAKPFPTSAHWYAQVGGRWLWRASSGSGGALVDAMREGGPLFAYRASATPEQSAEYLTVAAHDHLEVAEAIETNSILRFRPGCERCSNPGDERYRAVLAYAYLPAAGAEVEDLLGCGLRSGPVVMPPLK